MCRDEFDYVLKYETLKKESKEFISVSGIDGYLDAEIIPRQIGKPAHSTWLTHEQVTYLYFNRQLEEKDVDALFEIYRDDFRFFGYQFRFFDKVYPPEK